MSKYYYTGFDDAMSDGESDVSENHTMESHTLELSDSEQDEDLQLENDVQYLFRKCILLPCRHHQCGWMSQIQKMIQ